MSEPLETEQLVEAHALAASLLGARYQDRSISEEVRRSYLEYAMSVIVGRALPDARDGLKPVHRRVLYTMHEEGTTHSKPHLKSASTVGTCMAKYHPHGDASIYDALARMAQDWSLNEPLVDGQGNFGSCDGSRPAAPRYTEARMSRLAGELLTDIEAETVEFVENYDGRNQEPSVLPCGFPNLLVNGSAGIAVGMATSIPPHNLAEVIAATRALIQDPSLSVDALMERLPAPDFPTGGVIVGRRGIRDGYASGRGRCVLRAVHHLEERGRGLQQLVITQIPYGIQKGDARGEKKGLIHQIVQLVQEKKLPEITDIRDESAKDIRLVIELRAGALPEVLLNKLYKHTALQSTVSFNMVALHHGQPQTMGLREILHAYIEHRVEVLTRRSRFHLTRIRARTHILEGLLLALASLDRVISLIREASTRELAREQLRAELTLTLIQANAILDMRLGQLSNTDVNGVKSEYESLQAQAEELLALLGSEAAIRQRISQQLAELAEQHGRPRRSQIIPDEREMETEDLIPEQLSLVVLTEAGYLKRTSLEEFREQSRGGVGARGVLLQDQQDQVRLARVLSTHEWLLLLTDAGRIWRLRGWQVPEGSRSGKGRSLSNLLQIPDGERVVSLLNTREFSPEESVLFGSAAGLVKRTRLSEYDSVFKSAGKRALRLREGDRLVSACIAKPGESVLALTGAGRATRFPLQEVRSAGRDSSGVRAIRLSPGDSLVSLSAHQEGEDLILLSQDGFIKRVPLRHFRLKRRGGGGVRALPPGSRAALIAGLAAGEAESLLLLTGRGLVQRFSVSGLTPSSRSAKGVRAMRLSERDQLRLACLVTPEQLTNFTEAGGEQREPHGEGEVSPNFTEAGGEQREPHGEGEVSPNFTEAGGEQREPHGEGEVSPNFTEAGEEQREPHGEGEVSPSLSEAGEEQRDSHGEGGLEKGAGSV